MAALIFIQNGGSRSIRKPGSIEYIDMLSGTYARYNAMHTESAIEPSAAPINKP